MSYTYQEARTYPLNANSLYHLARSAVDATGTHLKESDINLGRLSAKCSVHPIPFLPFGDLLWMTLDVQIEPIDSSQSTALVISRFPELLQFTDLFHQNQKQVNRFFDALDYIIERKLATSM
jgi:hypothetical protein